MARKQIQVMVGAITDQQGQVLVSRRPDQSHQGGLWEFPGGKLEPGESRQQCLARELREELGISVFSSRPLIRVHHDYGDRSVLLDVFRIEAFGGTPSGVEGQPLSWIHPDAMDPAIFPAADRPIINALRLPALLLITGPDPQAPELLLERLERAIASGIELVQLRAHALSDSCYGDLARAAFDLCQLGGARLLLNRAPEVSSRLPRHGIHLSARTLSELKSRPGDATDLVGASCHNASELAHAAALGLDYALLSPVKHTLTHPQITPLGWQGFASLADPAALPVYALGGLDATDLGVAIEHGAQGIAAIRGLWPD